MSVDEQRAQRADTEISDFLARHAEELVLGTRPAEDVADTLAARLGRRRQGMVPALGFAWVIVLLALLAVALPALILGVGREPSAAELVTRAKAAAQNPPPFVMTVETDAGEMRFSYDGDGRALIESLDAGPEGFGGWVILTDGSREGFYNPDDGDEPWTVEERDMLALARLPVSWWADMTIRPGATELPTRQCPEPQRLPDGVVAERAAHRIACGAHTFWLDSKTLLVLRVDLDGRAFATSTSIDLAPAFKTETFAFDGSRFTARATPDRAPVAPGESHEPWRGQLLDGGDVVIGDASGRPQLVYAWAGWCDDACFGREVLDALAEMDREHGAEVDVLAVAVCDEILNARDAAERKGLDVVRVLVDTDCRVLDLWRREAIPFLLLYAADGKLAQTWGPGEEEAFPTRAALEEAVLTVIDQGS